MSILKFISKKNINLILATCCLIALGTYLWIPLDKELFSYGTGTSLVITDRHGIVLREILSSEGGRANWLKYEEIPEIVKRAVVSAEDKRFFSHFGVDILALGRAVLQNLQAGKVVSGASTLTQQLVKNRFNYPRTVFGKLREMIIAIRLEHMFSKEEILTQYLNRVSFSNQAFGIEAAARLYFAKPATHLSLAESIFLVGLIQAPSKYNPYRHFERARERQQRLLEQMYQKGEIDETSYQLAKQEGIRLIPKEVNFKAPHFCELILTQLKASPGGDAWATKVKTTLDYYLQQEIEEIVTTRIDELEEYNVTNAAVVVLDNSHGDILAYIGSKDFFDDEISGQVNGVTALRQPGSTLKPFTYQLALERSYTPATLIPDIKEYPAAPKSFIPENYDRKFHGPVRLREALACSYNLSAVRVLENIGVEVLYQRLHDLGFASLRETPTFYGPGLTLGNGEVTLLELVRAYSILARRGKGVTERYGLETQTVPSQKGGHQLEGGVHLGVDQDIQGVDQDGRHFESGAQLTNPQLFSPQVAYLIAHILADRQAAIPAFGQDSPLELPFPTAVKTGTSKDYRDNWTIGFTRDYTVGVWVGNFDGTPMQRVSGISGAGPIYHDVMLALYRYHSPISLFDDPPPGIVSQRICPLSGKLVNEDCPHAIEELFLAGTEPMEPCEMHKAYWVDSRDGLLTEPTSSHAVRRVFIYFPPLYQAWARKMGYLPPPEQYSPFRDQAEPLIRIVRPNNGDMFAIDPILRREYQTLQLTAVAAPGIEELTWYVDNDPLESVASPFRNSWEITPGTHRIYAEGQRNGEMLRSPEITVYIVE